MNRPLSGIPQALRTTRTGLDAKTLHFLEHSKARSTRRRYRSTWNAFLAWCELRRVSPLPATPATVSAYLSDRAAPDEGRPLKLSTLRVHLSAIVKAHRLAGFDSPGQSPLVHEALQGLRRTLGAAPVQKAPATVDVVRRLIAALPDGPKGIRDRALLLLGFAGAFRRSELASLDVGDIKDTPEGIRVRLRRSKTDQGGEGRSVAVCFGSAPGTCPVLAVRAWTAMAQAESGPLFRSVTRHGSVTDRRLAGRDVARVVKAAAVRAGLDPSTFSGHSLRAGHVTQALRGGAAERDVARTTGHRSVAVLRRYAREANLFRGASSARLGL